MGGFSRPAAPSINPSQCNVTLIDPRGLICKHGKRSMGWRALAAIVAVLAVSTVYGCYLGEGIPWGAVEAFAPGMTEEQASATALAVAKRAAIERAPRISPEGEVEGVHEPRRVEAVVIYELWIPSTRVQVNLSIESMSAGSGLRFDFLGPMQRRPVIAFDERLRTSFAAYSRIWPNASGQKASPPTRGVRRSV